MSYLVDLGSKAIADTVAEALVARADQLRRAGEAAAAEVLDAGGDMRTSSVRVLRMIGQARQLDAAAARIRAGGIEGEQVTATPVGVAAAVARRTEAEAPLPEDPRAAATVVALRAAGVSAADAGDPDDPDEDVDAVLAEQLGGAK